MTTTEAIERLRQLKFFDAYGWVRNGGNEVYIDSAAEYFGPAGCH